MENENIIYQPREFVEYCQDQCECFDFEPPDGAILSYEEDLDSIIGKGHNAREVEGPYGKMYILAQGGKRIGVNCGFGIGAPAAVAVLEELIAHGVKKFISIGTAGSIDPKCKIGDIVLCNKAYRDEGVSRHYTHNIKEPSLPSGKMNGAIKKALVKRDVEYKQGATWTTDTPYREKISDREEYRRKGVRTVDLEASALFTVAGFREVEMAALFTIGDLLHDQWEPHFCEKAVKKGIGKIFEVAKEALSH